MPAIEATQYTLSPGLPTEIQNKPLIHRAFDDSILLVV